MNVLQLISSGAGFYGAERVLVTLSAELQRMGVNTVVGAFRHRSRPTHLEVLDRAQRCGLATEEVTYRGRFDRSAIVALQTLVRRHSIDVIHSHEATANFYALLAAGRTPTGLVSTCHSWLINSFKDWMVSVADRATLRGFDAVVVVNERLRKPLDQFRVRPQNIHNIGNGIDAGPFVRAADTAIWERGSGEGLVVGTVARLAPEKGLHYLLEAAAILIPEYPLTEFVVVGDGPELEALQRHASRLGIVERVRFPGSFADMPGVYASFDIFVLPSLTEAMPMALMEAMATGTPVVATSVGAVPQMIQQRDNGILIEPADTASLVGGLRSLLSSRELRTTLGLAAQHTATSSFSATVMAQRYLALYESVTRCSSGGAVPSPTAVEGLFQ
jgi:glycosyltransferase involved in cell wall biosynthesis